MQQDDPSLGNNKEQNACKKSFCFAALQPHSDRFPEVSFHNKMSKTISPRRDEAHEENMQIINTK